MEASRLESEEARPIGLIGALSNWDDPDPAITGFLDTLRDGVVVVGQDLRIKYFNASHGRQLGIEPGALYVGQHLRDSLVYLAGTGKLGQGLEGDPEAIADARVARWGSEVNRVERRHVRDDLVLDIYRTHTERGETIAVHVDVSEQVRAAEKIESQQILMESLLENTSDGITLIDRNGNFAMFNDRLLDLYRVDPAKVYWGIPYMEMVAEFGDMQELSPAARAREAERRRQFAFDPTITTVRRHLRDGRTLHINKTNLPDGGCVLTVREMTAELAREEELLKARHTAEESSRHKSEFVARMSHEMRTPLNGILGVAALMERTDLTEKQQALIDVISSSGKVLLRLIDDILDLSRIDADSFEVVAERMAIGDVVRQCISIVQPSASEQGLEIRLTGDHDAVPALKGDIVRIKQILLNLLTNAVKFTESGHVELGLTHETGPEGITITFCVSDTGVGIAADKLDQIFNRFYQIDGTVTRRHGGAGLGLAITRKLVDAMGGTIQVRSTPGVGTEFRVRLTLPPAGRAGRDR